MQNIIKNSIFQLKKNVLSKDFQEGYLLGYRNATKKVRSFHNLLTIIGVIVALIIGICIGQNI